ncbi:clathrin interactor EPSIN 1-like [Zingiber officinale]|uniref:clathrin interactor EPSIN 1-like n=1 Tax=Zingiber officinale TaxID=94328 RepID=UPI001C4B76DA|nr:clathrin interactor EPSIN 1-like [Zingiber officinale]
MDFMKVLDQTVREIKREVNLKVLKVPEIEQKVLDATNDEPWGPHGTALSEISHATKKFTECQMIMGVLWSRLSDTGPNWRHVYKALTVIEYLIANGSERAVDDILEHTFQISALSSFEYVEPNGKDVGINVRKKVETILALLNDREKIQAIRDKAASNRDKYVGLSSKGISYKSSSASYSSSSYGSGYGSNSRDVDSFSDSYKEGEHGKESKWKNDKKYGQNSENVAENEGIKSKKPVPLHSRNQDSSPTSSLKISNKSGSIPSSKSTTVKSKNEVDDFDDFDPRGSSSAGLAAARSNQVDLFGENLLDDLMDISASVPPTTSINDTANHEVDLFADATFQSAPHAEAKPFSHVQGSDLFDSQQEAPVAFDPTADPFAAPGPAIPSETKSPEQPDTKSFDPFAAIPINNFNDSDPFGTFASHGEPVTMQSSQSSPNSGKSNLDEDSIFGEFTSHNEQTTRESSRSNISNLKTPLTSLASTAMKDNFQVKSGVWSDCLSRGLIDLNISAPKKVNLADIGIVGGLDDASMEKEKTLPTAAFMGRAMNSSSGSGLDRSVWSGFSTATGVGGSMSTFGQHEFGGFK